MTLGAVVLAHPGWLLLLPVVWLLLWRLHARAAAATEHPGLVLLHPGLGGVSGAPPVPRRGSTFWLAALVFSLLLLGLSRPQSIGDWVIPEPLGREMVILVDTSGSMGIRDFQHEGRSVARIDVLKGVVSRFVQARPHDHFALIVFASEAATLVPMTHDGNLVVRMLQRLALGVAGRDTAMGDALALALKQLHGRSEPRPALLLFSDGDNTAGLLSPEEALWLAEELGVAIYTVAVMAIDAAYGSELGERTLRELAEQTGGRYYEAGSHEDLLQVVRDIDQLERTVAPPPQERMRHEWYWVPILAALLALTLARLVSLIRSWQ